MKVVNDPLTFSSAVVYAVSTAVDLRDEVNEPVLVGDGRAAASLNASTTTVTVLKAPLG